MAPAAPAETAPLPLSAASPAVTPCPPETMQAYFTRLRAELDPSAFHMVQRLDGDGLYVGKRPVRGAQGQGALLNEAGTVLQHTLLYVVEGGQVTALEFGPAGGADVTANVMEAAPCGPIALPGVEPDQDTRLLWAQVPCVSLTDPLVQKAIRFAGSSRYHAVTNNCVHNADFLARVLTRGRLRSAPLVFDAVAGVVPAQDHPMLLMFFLMTQLSWFNVVDGSAHVAAFMQEEGLLARTPPAPGAEGGRLREKETDLLGLARGLSNGGPPGAAQ